MSINKVGVVGAGMMGAEIALCFARAGIATVLNDLTLEIASNGKKKQAAILDKQIAKGKLEAHRKEEILDSVHITEKIEDLADCNLVIEAVLEVFDIKKEIFSKLDSACDKNTILASNTSSISITKLASAVSDDRKGLFVGTHFNSPASVMKLIEVIPALLTEERTVDTVTQILKEIDKEPVRVKDVEGFGLNRLFHVFYLEACRLVEEGVCSAEDVDKICLYGLGHPMGIFKLLDITGHDLNQRVDEILFDAYGERYRPSPVIRRLVDSGRLGRKTGAGFYEYK
ncbi:MAG: 3-hydroxyacyl-CoA dehydrogenase family protein [Clostridiales Family XIII bacterium]|jgi:3-hydroxybutyryl-CoA dehydrogenase|nr:3-hydroxyacyl-CoA dehydrogenase family protein [Clostridiales Family XIII bacterium]